MVSSRAIDELTGKKIEVYSHASELFSNLSMSLKNSEELFIYQLSKETGGR